MKLLIPFFILTFTCSFAVAEINTELSRMLYEIPAPPGMEVDRKNEFITVNISPGIERNVSQIVFRSKGDSDISAPDIIEFYDNYFIPKGFRKWGQANALSDRYQAPSIVTRGSAYIRSQGHISYHIPPNGNFIVFWVEQRRSFNISGSENTISKIKDVFEDVSSQLDYKFSTPPNFTIFDWGEYIVNECMVTRVISFINYQDSRGGGSFADGGSYRFYFVIFPTHKHAIQWKERTIESVRERQPYPNYLQDGLGMPPIVISNIVVEYKGDVFDVPNAVLKDRLTSALTLVAEQYNNEPSSPLNSDGPRE